MNHVTGDAFLAEHVILGRNVVLLSCITQLPCRPVDVRVPDVRHRGIERNVRTYIGRRIVAVVEANSHCPFVLGGVAAFHLLAIHSALHCRRSIHACMCRR